MNINNELLQIMVKQKIIRSAQIPQIIEECDKLHISVEKYVVDKEICTEVDLLPALGEFYNMPYIELAMLNIDKKLLNNFNLGFLKKQKIVPIKIDENGVLLVAVGKPLDYIAISSIASFYNGPIDFVLVPVTQINVYIDSIKAVKSTADALEDLQKEKDKTQENSLIKANTKAVEKEDDVINAPAVRLVDSFIKEAIPFRASDIHIEPFEKEVKVRYRIDGDLQERATFPIESFPAICARIKIMSGMDIAERRIPQDGRINLDVNGAEYDFRVSSLPTVHGEKIVIRVLDKSNFNFSRKDLGFTDNENKIVDKILAHPYGIILLTGPTGCGKSTTLYSFLKEINKPEVNILTVEDPVEYTMAGVNQTQVNIKANMTFARALRSILRQDPDIIMIGEIRDEETAQIAIRAAITGHLVLSTLHTNDAPGAVVRLTDMGVNAYLVGDSLVGVISQRLIKRLCPMCKKKEKSTEKEMALLGVSKPVEVCHPKGCQFCNHTGYKGRVAVHEIMYVNERMRDAINKTTTVEALRELAKQEGMIELSDSCKYYLLNGQTSIEEYLSLNIDE